MNVGIIGYGGLGKLHARNLATIPGARLAAVCETRYVPQSDGAYAHFDGGGKAAKPAFTVYTKADRMFARESLDVVINALPSHLHTAYNILALEHGCHVFTEKPFALTVADCDAVLRAAKRNRRLLMVGHCMRFWPGWMELKDFVRTRRFGRLRYLALRRTGSSPKAGSWFFDPQKSGGVTLDLHIHDVDFAAFLLGVPESITASGVADRSRGLQVVTAQYRYPGALVEMENAWFGWNQCPFTMEFQAVFERKVLRYQGGKLLGYAAGKRAFQELPIGGTSGHRAELVYFLDCVARGRPPERCRPEESRDSVALALAGARGIASGKPVRPAGKGARS